jgi:hypothetical protein
MMEYGALFFPNIPLKKMTCSIFKYFLSMAQKKSSKPVHQESSKNLGKVHFTPQIKQTDLIRKFQRTIKILKRIKPD